MYSKLTYFFITILFSEKKGYKKQAQMFYQNNS